MYTNDYDYTRVNAIKIIVKNAEGKVLLIQEPATNDWMPLHWGLPGGKPTNRESLLETFERKCMSDLGSKLTLKGIFRTYELLQEKRSVLMIIVVAEGNLTEIKGEIGNYKWVGLEDVTAMDITEFTEFYNKEMLIDLFTKAYDLVDFNSIRTLPFYSMSADQEYTRWLESGKK